MADKVNLLEKTIAYISPERATRREAWRQQLEVMRSYDAATHGRYGRGWTTHNEAAEYTDRPARDVIRARARDLERNSDFLGGLLSAFKRNIVGYGYTLQASTGNPELDDKIEKEWKNWCKKQHCDVTGQQSLNQLLRMAVERKKVDGGILFLKTYTGSGAIPLQLQPLEVDEIALNQATPKNKNNKVVDGIELTPFNKPVGFWIERYQLDGFSLSEPQFIKADRIIYLWSRKRPSQVREMSDFSQTLPRIRDVNEFMNAIAVKERIAACLSVFIKKSMPAQTGGYGRVQVKEDGTVDYAETKLSPGMILQMNPGDEAQVVDPKGVSGESKSLIEVQQRLIASGQGLSHEAVSRDMSSVNYSSARQDIIEDDLAYAEDKELILELLDDIYEAFLMSGYLSGVFDLPGYFTDRESKHRYNSHQWVCAPKPWIDPMKEANSNQIALSSGIKTFQTIAAEQGRDWREMIDEVAEVRDYCKSKNIRLGGELYAYEEDTDTEQSSGEGG